MNDEHAVDPGLAIPERSPLFDEPSAGDPAELEDGLRTLIQELALCRRELRDQKQDQNNVMRGFLLELLEVSDAFARLLQSARERGKELDPVTKRWINNFRTVDRLLTRALRNQGLVEIETLDRIFDPTWHTAVKTVEDTEQEDGAICTELNKGYVWKNQVLRKTEVTVVKNND